MIVVAGAKTLLLPVHVVLEHVSFLRCVDGDETILRVLVVHHVLLVHAVQGSVRVGPIDVGPRVLYYLLLAVQAGVHHRIVAGHYV
jgi:hypothetical protein